MLLVMLSNTFAHPKLTYQARRTFTTHAKDGYTACMEGIQYSITRDLRGENRNHDEKHTAKKKKTIYQQIKE